MYEKYEKAIKIVDNILEIHDKVRDTIDEVERQQLMKNNSVLFGKLINHFNKTFAAPISSSTPATIQNVMRHRDTQDEIDVFNREINEIQQCWNGNSEKTADEYVRQFREIPPIIVEYVFPVAVVRLLLSGYHLKIDAKQPYIINGNETIPWIDFCVRYGELIFSIR